jgi:SIR2-like domain
MDIQPNDLAFIKRALQNNSAVLFTGAGFSRAATNISDRNMPAGESLADELWAYLGYSGSRGKNPLKNLYEAALGREHAPLRDFLRSNFECKSYSSWYRHVPTFYWYRIYTTNIDNVLEKVFSDVRQSRLKSFDGRRDDYTERDPFLEEIQYIKLNGRDYTEPKEVTFGFLQYARRAGDAPDWYEQLARDFATRPIFFVGSELDEPLFWQAIEMRGKRFSEFEKRPKSFWIKPHFSEADLENIKLFNVVAIPGTAEEFFSLLHYSTATERNKTEVLKAAHPAFHELATSIVGEINKGQYKDLQTFYAAFAPVLIPDRIPSTRKAFLTGAEPDWPAIYNDLDAPRGCTGDLIKLIEISFGTPALSVVSVSGYAGSGKSSLLMRAAVTLRAKGHLVLWSDGTTTVPHHVFSTIADILTDRPIIFIDNIAMARGALIDYLKSQVGNSKAPVFVIAERTSKHFAFELALAADYTVQKFSIPNLSADDIKALIDRLSAHGMLGKLTGLPRPKQIYELTVRAGKQLLVAMREATKGKAFDLIIEDELGSLPTTELQIVYAAVCIATSAGYSLSQQQFVAVSDLEPNKALAILEDELRDIVFSIRGDKGGLIARHRIIANVLVESIVNRELLQQAYIRLLAVISKDVPRPVKTSSRAFKMYREVVNHQTIWERFPHNIAQARSIYDSVREHFKQDSHFWLQYGSLELEYGELELADLYISSAESLAPTDDFVQNTKGLLLYKRAIKSTRLGEALTMRESARETLSTQIKKRPTDSYAPHMMYSQELAFIGIWVTDREQRKEALEALRRDIAETIKSNRYSERLSSLQREIEGAYLQLAV